LNRVDDVHVDRHSLALGEQVGDADRRDDELRIANRSILHEGPRPVTLSSSPASEAARAERRMRPS